VKIWTKKKLEELAGRPKNHELRVAELHSRALEVESSCRVAWLAMHFCIAVHHKPRNFAWLVVHFLHGCALANFCDKSHFQAYVLGGGFSRFWGYAIKASSFHFQNPLGRSKLG